jgi:hypothetical protein
MPPLPKKRQKKEADVTPLVVAWFREHYPRSCALEIKVGDNKILPHQDRALKETQNGCFSYKIPDMGRQNPFDAFLLKGADGVLVRCDGRQCRAEVYDGTSFDFKI